MGSSKRPIAVNSDLVLYDDGQGFGHVENVATGEEYEQREIAKILSAGVWGEPPGSVVSQVQKVEQVIHHEAEILELIRTVGTALEALIQALPAAASPAININTPEQIPTPVSVNVPQQPAPMVKVEPRVSLDMVALKRPRAANIIRNERTGRMTRIEFEYD